MGHATFDQKCLEQAIVINAALQGPLATAFAAAPLERCEIFRETAGVVSQQTHVAALRCSWKNRKEIENLFARQYFLNHLAIIRLDQDGAPFEAALGLIGHLAQVAS